MKNKYRAKLAVLAIGSVTLLSSCSYYISTINEEKALADIKVGVVSQTPLQQTEKNEQLKGSMKQALKVFFSNYYKIDLATGLEANKAPGFYTSKLDLPRFVDINGSTIIAYKDIDNIDLNILNNTDNRYELQVKVDVIVDTVKKEVFNTKYYYLSSEGYYKDLATQFSQQDLDQYKIRASYYVNGTMTAEKLVIDQLVEKTDFFITKQKKYKKENNDFITRLPFKNEPTKEDIMPVEAFFNQFFAQDYDSLKYFRDMQNRSFSNVNDYFEKTLNVKEFVLLDEATYNENFPTSIAPIRDNNVKLEKIGEITVKPCTDSSLKHQKYFVEIPVNLKRSDASTQQRIYIYEVEVNKKSGLYRIEALKYVSSRKLLVEENAKDNAVQSTQSSTVNLKKGEAETVNSLKDIGI